MANVKISELTATTSFGDNDYTMIVQSNENKKITKTNMFGSITGQIGNMANLKTQNTSDVVSAINSTIDSEVYSTTEVKTDMIWVDEKPIYRKVIVINRNISNTDVSFSTGITNLSEVCFFTGAVHRKSYSKWFDLGNQYISELKLDETNNNIIINTTSSGFVIDKGNITIYYTKTTD